MKSKTSVIVALACESTPEIYDFIEKSITEFLRLSDCSAWEIIESENLLDALNRHVNNKLVHEFGIVYGSVIIHIVYTK